MKFEIITPDEKVMDGEVSAVSFPGTDGSFQVLNNHAPLISSLKKGKLTYKTDKTEETIVISGGVVEVKNNVVIVLAESILKNEDPIETSTEA